MKLTKCPNGHFYDADKHPECPYCNGGLEAGSAIAQPGTAAEAGLADAWRAGEAHDGPTRFGFELVNAEELQNAVLDLVEAVVIRVQGLPGIFDVEVVL